MTIRKIRGVGLIFTSLGLAFSIVFLGPVEIERNPQVWFEPEYYSQFIPLYIAITLFLSGVLIFGRFSQANFYLAVFGHTASEEILFNAIGITQSALPLYAAIVFLPLSLITLWLAYFNVLKLKRLSVGEATFGVLFSTACILLPRFL